MYFGKMHHQVNMVGELLMSSNPYWFNNQVVFFDENNRGRYPQGFLSLYDIFVDQLDIKLYEEQLEDTLPSSNACFFFMS